MEYIISAVITGGVYMLVPAIIAISAPKLKKSTIVAIVIVNCIFVFIGFNVLRYFMGVELSYNVSPMLLWSLVNYTLLAKRCLRDNDVTDMENSIIENSSSNNNFSTDFAPVQPAKKSDTFRVLLIVINIFLLLSLCGTSAYIIYQNQQIQALLEMNHNYQSQITSLKRTVKDSEFEEKQLEYIYNYDEPLVFSEFHSWSHVIVLEKGEQTSGVLTCDYSDAIVYSDIDNNNITLLFDEEWHQNRIGYTVTGVKKGCSTITFTNDQNELKDTVLVIVK